MLLKIYPDLALPVKGDKKTARCRLCNDPMIGIRNWNIRFYCDSCDPIMDQYDVFPQRIPPKICHKK